MLKTMELFKFTEVYRQNSFYQQMQLLLTIYIDKIYIKISYIRSYMFRSTWTETCTVL